MLNSKIGNPCEIKIIPAITRSIAASKCFLRIIGDKSRAAINAASLQTFAMSAPVNPGVRAANFLDNSTLSKSIFKSPR